MHIVTHMHTHMHAHVHTHTCIHTHAYTHTYTHTRACTHTHIHTHTHTHVHTLVLHSLRPKLISTMNRRRKVAHRLPHKQSSAFQQKRALKLINQMIQ